MGELKNWAFSLCCGAAAGAILSLLAPNSSLGRVCRFSIRAFFLCCMVLPLRQIGDFFHVFPEVQTEAAYSAQEIAGVVAAQVESSAASSLEKEVSRYLEKEGINFKKVEADIHVGQDGGISINCIRVLLPPEAEDQAFMDGIARLIQSQTGLSAEVTAENGGGASWANS